MNVNQKGCFAEYKFATAAMECGLNVSMPLLDSSIYDWIVEHEGVFQKSKSKTQMTGYNPKSKKVFTFHCVQTERFTIHIWLMFLQYMFMTVSLLFQMKNNAPSGLFAAESIPIFLITLHHSSISRISLFNKEKASNLFGVFFCIFVK